MFGVHSAPQFLFEHASPGDGGGEPLNVRSVLNCLATPPADLALEETELLPYDPKESRVFFQVVSQRPHNVYIDRKRYIPAATSTISVVVFTQSPSSDVVINMERGASYHIDLRTWCAPQRWRAALALVESWGCADSIVDVATQPRVPDRLPGGITARVILDTVCDEGPLASLIERPDPEAIEDKMLATVRTLAAHGALVTDSASVFLPFLLWPQRLET